MHFIFLWYIVERGVSVLSSKCHQKHIGALVRKVLRHKKLVYIGNTPKRFSYLFQGNLKICPSSPRKAKKASRRGAALLTDGGGRRCNGGAERRRSGARGPSRELEWCERRRLRFSGRTRGFSWVGREALQSAAAIPLGYLQIAVPYLSDMWGGSIDMIITEVQIIMKEV